MKRVLPYPAMSLFLLVTWLVLNQSIAVGQILIGVFLGILLGHAFRILQPPPLRVRNHLALMRLLIVVAGDVIRSNIAVLLILLGGKRKDLKSGFVHVPLQLTDPYGLALLACIITATPGTIWMSYRAMNGVLLIHVFDLVDEEAWIRNITRRYVEPLREIFE